jgi:hypothetical protein
MNTAATLTPLIERQQQRLRDLREDASDIAAIVADEVWDRFEREIDEYTEDGFYFDFAANTKMGLSATLSSAYDDAFERHVSNLFATLEGALREAAPELAGFEEGASIDLKGLRKGIKLYFRADEMIGKAIDAAKPGLLRAFFAAEFGTDAWDREIADDARRVREKLLALRDPLTALIRQETETVIQSGRLAYGRWLDDMLARLGGGVAEADLAAEEAR